MAGLGVEVVAVRRLIEQLYGRMPREFAHPQRMVVESVDRLVGCVDQYNGLDDCFVSAFAFGSDERSYGDVLINKAVFDFDGAWDDLVRTHEWLEERDVAHFAVFSGSDRSGHLYVLTEPTTHQQSLEYFQRDVVIDGVGLRRCRDCGGALDRVEASAVAAWRCDQCGTRRTESDTDLVVDSNLVGDPATMIRVPNTWHPSAERFCVPLRPSEIDSDPRDIYDIATAQRDLELGDIVCGSKTPDIAQKRGRAEELYRSYDEQRRLAGFESDQKVLDEFEADVPPADMLDEMGCTCVRSMVTDEDGRITKPALGHDKRRTLISYLVERGYNPEEISQFLRLVLDDAKARHSIVEEEQPVRIWRDGVKAPNKVTLKRRGMWRQDCPEHAEVAAGAEA